MAIGLPEKMERPNGRAETFPEPGVVGYSDSYRGGSAPTLIALFQRAYVYKWRILLIALTIAIAAHQIVSRCFTKWYRAEAILRPASQESTSSIAIGAMLGRITGIGGEAAKSSLLPLLGFNAMPVDAAEQLTILRSYDFAMTIIERERLQDVLSDKTSSGNFLGKQRKPTKWDLYEAFKNRFDFKYDQSFGNITLGFIDSNPARAAQVEKSTIEQLRVVLRNRLIASADSAITALEQHKKSVADAVLLAEIDSLIAQEMQIKYTAEAQADFAFSVIQPPVVPTRPYAPHPARVAAIMFVLTVCIALYRCARTKTLPERHDRAGGSLKRQEREPSMHDWHQGRSL